MQPAKVFIGQDSYMAEATARAAAAVSCANLVAEACSRPSPQMPLSTGEWVAAVTQTAPCLDQQGIQEAIIILDTALNNVQHLKAIDAYMATANQTVVGYVSYGAAEMMRQQVNERQQVLLQKLHQLGKKGMAQANASRRAGFMPPSLNEAIASYPSLNEAQLDLYLSALMNQYVPVQMPCMPMEMPIEPNPHHSAMPAMPEDHMQRSKPRAQRQVQTLSTSLQMLSKEDPDTLLIVRRINKLGFKGAKKLKTYFAQFGQVSKVLVAHSTCRQTGDIPCQARRRPSSLGFVHMASADAVQKVLACGADQEVDGAVIRVQMFERQHGEAAIAEAQAEADGLKDFDDKDWLHHRSSKSNSSTTASSTSNAGSDS